MCVPNQVYTQFTQHSRGLRTFVFIALVILDGGMFVCVADHCENTKKKRVVSPKSCDLLRHGPLSTLTCGCQRKPNKNSRLAAGYFERYLRKNCGRRQLKDNESAPVVSSTCCMQSKPSESGLFKDNPGNLKKIQRVAHLDTIKNHSNKKHPELLTRAVPNESSRYVTKKASWYQNRRSQRNGSCNTLYPCASVKRSKESNIVEKPEESSSKRNQFLFQVLEEHVAPKTELGRLTRICNSVA